jgi:hypothetical protein
MSRILLLFELSRREYTRRSIGSYHSWWVLDLRGVIMRSGCFSKERDLSFPGWFSDETVDLNS